MYVESADQFLAIDLRKWVEGHYGEEILRLDQKSVRVKVHKRNVLDDHFFQIVLDRNLIPVLRTTLREDDNGIARFLRDSSVVHWLHNCREEGRDARLMVIKWMSKMRTEVYFQSKAYEGEWDSFRTHWQFSMGDFSSTFPYLAFTPALEAMPVRWSETDEDFDGTPFEVWHESFSVTAPPPVTSSVTKSSMESAYLILATKDIPTVTWAEAR